VWNKTLFLIARALKDNNLKEVLFIIFALFFVMGLIVLRLRFIKDRNPNAELLIELLRLINMDKDSNVRLASCMLRMRRKNDEKMKKSEFFY